MTDLTRPRPAAVWQPARVQAVNPLTKRVKSFLIAPETARPWLPGQHVDVRLTADDGYSAQRSYSIANVWREGQPVELAIEQLDDGEVSGYFHEVAQAGDRFEIKMPLGYHFTWRASDGPALLIAGGSGVVPLMSMARHHALENIATEMVMLYSSRRWEDVIFADELTHLRQASNTFACRFALTRETALQDGDFSRRIDADMLREVIANRTELTQSVYICGSNAFVGAAEAACRGAGIEDDAIRTERYGS